MFRGLLSKWRSAPIVGDDDLPDEMFIDSCFEDSSNTPDIMELERKSHQLLFVYDEMEKNHPAHDLIKEFSARLHTAFTQPEFTLWKKKAGIYTNAFALEAEFSNVRKARIRGRLYIVESPRFTELDKYKENGVWSVRRRVKVTVPYRTVSWTHEHGLKTSSEQTWDVHAHMYVGIREYWNEHLDNGYLCNPVAQYEPKEKFIEEPYYQFSTKEYGP